MQVDTSDFASVQDALHSIEDSFGRTVDVLVNNAALPPIPRPFLELAWTEIERSLDTHVRSAVVCCQAVLPGMLRQRSGRIVNLGAAFTRTVPPPQWTAFVMAKAALISLTRSLAAEFGPQGITVNVVSPGITETESMAAIPDRLRKVQAMQTPLRRLARPEDIAGTVAFLCSEAADHITGIEIPVCGGATV